MQIKKKHTKKYGIAWERGRGRDSGKKNKQTKSKQPVHNKLFFLPFFYSSSFSSEIHTTTTTKKNKRNEMGAFVAKYLVVWYASVTRCLCTYKYMKKIYHLDVLVVLLLLLFLLWMSLLCVCSNLQIIPNTNRFWAFAQCAAPKLNKAFNVFMNPITTHTPHCGESQPITQKPFAWTHSALSVLCTWNTTEIHFW